jgi:hypothetical protein
MDPRDRRLLIWIAVSTTFVATVVACVLVYLIVVLAFAR